MISRLDIDVQFVSLPQVRNQEVSELMRYKIRSIYPGAPEKTVFDYVLLGKKQNRYAALCIARKEVVDAHREIAAKKPLFHSLSLLIPFVEQHAGNDLALVMYHEDCIETLIYSAGVFQSSCVMRRTNVLVRDLRKLWRILLKSAADSEIVFFCAERELRALKQVLSTETGSKKGRIMLHPYRVLSQNTLKKSDYLFSEKKERPFISQKILIPSLGFLCFLLAGAALHKNLLMKKSLYAELSLQLQQLERKKAHDTSLKNEMNALEDELQALGKKIPCNIYLLLAELYAIVGPDTRVTRFSVEKNMFQIEGVSPSPLHIMARFEDSDAFDGVQLSQIIPLENSGEKRFKVQGFVKVH